MGVVEGYRETASGHPWRLVVAFGAGLVEEKGGRGGHLQEWVGGELRVGQVHKGLCAAPAQSRVFDHGDSERIQAGHGG